MKPRYDNGQHLVDGLNHHERITRLETATTRGPNCLWDQLENLRVRVQALESAQRRREMPWYLRWFVLKPIAAKPATKGRP